jgi:hypothetical protein
MAKKDLFNDLFDQLKKGVEKEKGEKTNKDSKEPINKDPTLNIRLGACYLLYFIIVLYITISAKESIGNVVIGFSASLLSLIIFTILVLRINKRILEHFIITIVATTVIFFLSLREIATGMDVPQLAVLNLAISFFFILILLIHVPKSDDENPEDEDGVLVEPEVRENVDYSSDYSYAPTHNVEHQHVQYVRHKKTKKKPKKASKHPHIEDLRTSESSHLDIEDLRLDAQPDEFDMAVPEQFTTSEERYFAKIAGTKYHEPGCMIGEKIAEQDRIWFSSKEEAEDQGLKPCRICVP